MYTPVVVYTNTPDGRLYWSNKIGWVDDKELATEFDEMDFVYEYTYTTFLMMNNAFVEKIIVNPFDFNTKG